MFHCNFDIYIIHTNYETIKTTSYIYNSHHILYEYIKLENNTIWNSNENNINNIKSSIVNTINTSFMKDILVHY